VRIYVDESGSFVPGAASSRVCCEAALVVPESVAPSLLSAYSELRSAWTSEAEIKGSSLTNEQTAAALRLLGCYDILVEISAVDVGHQGRAQLNAFRLAQADAIIAELTPRHNANAHEWAHALRDQWLRLSPQLMLQAYALVIVASEVVRAAPNYYAQRSPNELARFDWVLDPKDVKPSRFELTWRQIVCPLLQSMSMREPFARVEGFDYSALTRFFMVTPDYLLPYLPRGRTSPGDGLNLQLVFNESIAFPNSKDDLGLQLADIVASAFAKAMNGKLPPTVFRLLGPLMVEKPRGAPIVRLIALGPGPAVRVGDYHTYVLKALRNRAKPMMMR